MKTTNLKSRLMLLVAILAFSTSFYGCSKNTESSVLPVSASDSKEAIMNYTQPESTDFIASAVSMVPQPLSEAEVNALMVMREEELLAHDVYLALSQLYSRPVFKNITKSEAVHTEAIRKLLVKYQIPDPAANHLTGVFNNADLQALYTLLVETGSQSLLQGVTVGATIEDLDIFDLQNHLLEVDNRDIIIVFNNLKSGSENHLRAFYANIIGLGGSYTPQYISIEEFNAIINQ